MPKHTMKMVLEFANVFPEKADMGKPDSSEKWLRDLAKNGGQTVVNAYFTSEDQIDYLVNEGFERMATNPKNGESVDRIKNGNKEFGIGKYITLKRRIQDVREYKDSKTGEIKELDLGGYPKVVDLTNGPENKRWWSYEEDGALGNGTVAKVQFDMYKGTTLRLEAIGVLEHVPFEPKSESNEDDELFNVDGDAA